jgi:phosphoribosylglycinamide formyltransferase-1
MSRLARLPESAHSAGMKIAVLASGRGSNLRAIAEAIERGACSARIVAVVSDKPDAAALAFASERGVATAVVPPKAHASRELWDAALAETVASFSPELVVLAGFMRIVGASMLARFPQRIVNVHPALLPSFPGAHGARDAIAKGVRISGCTVHVVDAGVDTGPILAQAAVPVWPSDDEASLQARIQKVEHRLLPAVIDAIAKGTLTLGASGPSFGADLPFDERALVSPSFGAVSPSVGGGTT